MQGPRGRGGGGGAVRTKHSRGGITFYRLTCISVNKMSKNEMKQRHKNKALEGPRRQIGSGCRIGNWLMAFASPN